MIPKSILKQISEKVIEYSKDNSPKQVTMPAFHDGAMFGYSLASPVVERDERLVWVKASERLPDSYDAHEKHVRQNGKKVSGIFIEAEGGGMVFEYWSFDGYRVIEDLSTIEWLDESETPSHEGKDADIRFTLNEILTYGAVCAVKGRDMKPVDYFMEKFQIDITKE